VVDGGGELLLSRWEWPPRTPPSGRPVPPQAPGAIASHCRVADSCGHLYAATDASAFLHPGSVVEVDFETGAVLRAVHVLGEPFNLVVSDDCTTLYAALDASNSVARIRLSDMTVDAVLPLGIESNKFLAMLRGRSLSVAPGQPLTVAIAKGDMDVSLCGGSDDGVVIFDDTVNVRKCVSRSSSIALSGSSLGLRTPQSKSLVNPHVGKRPV